MAKITLNGTNGITGFKSDNTTVDGTYDASRLNSLSPTNFPSASSLVVEGVGFSAISAPPLLLLNTGEELPIQGPFTLTNEGTINSLSNRREVRASDFIIAGGTLIIPANFWVWSDTRSIAALIVDVNNATITNNGVIIGKGGSSSQTGGDAISVTGTGVTINNASGAYIAGGGGGGGGGRNSYGGAGAGGGGGGSSNTNNMGTGGILNAAGGRGLPNGSGGSVSITPGYGGGAGGGGGGLSWAGYAGGGGGGRILAGSGGAGGQGVTGSAQSPIFYYGGAGGSNNNAGANGQDAGDNPPGYSQYSGAGGGGWGASSGVTYNAFGGIQGPYSGGSAVSGSYTQGTWSGTVYGSS